MNNLNQLQLISQLYSNDANESDENDLFDESSNETDFVQHKAIEEKLSEIRSNEIENKPEIIEKIIENKDKKIISTSINDLNENSESNKNTNRKCTVCLSSEFKYKCPSCLVHTCSLNCFKQHKITMKCSGLRNSLRFKRLENFDDDQLRNDFHFLEDFNRQIDGMKRQKRNIVQSLSDLPNWLKKLKYEANRRLIKLKILPAGLKRRLQNKTAFMYSTGEIYWDIEIVFVDLHFRQTDLNSNQNLESITQNDLILTNRLYANRSSLKKITFHIERVPEKQILNDLLISYLKPENLIENQQLNSLLKYYQNANEDEIAILIKLSFDYYLELNPQMTINDCLKHKTIVEYPILLVVLRKNLGNYKLVKENELRNRMQDYADKSYDLSIKNGLTKRHFDKFERSSKKFENSDSNGTIGVEETVLLDEEKTDDQSLNDQNSTEFYEESEDDEGPLEIKTRYVFNNAYNDDQVTCDP